METKKIKGLEELGLGGLEHFSVRDYLRLFGRRKWIVLLTMLSVALATAILTSILPNVYRATTVILVDPRKISDNIVATTVTSGVADRLVTLRQQVLSISRLRKIIDEMGLYKELRERRSQDEIAEIMRRSIEIDVAASASGDRGLGAFSISYSSGNAEQAASVTNRLASLFIDENVKAREEQVVGTSEFVDKELDDARKDLETKEEKIRQVKSRYASELPESQTMHVQALNSLQLELRGEMDGASRAHQQKVYLQTMLTDAAPVVNLDKQGSDSSELIPLKTRLIQAQTQLNELRKRYGPEHPDVIKKGMEVANLDRQVEEIQNRAETEKPQTRVVPKHQNPVLESQIAAIDEEMKKHEAREAEIRKEMAFHQSKLEQIPVIEQQMASITRDYDVARDHYRLLLDRKFSADISSDMETRQKGERFVILDRAQVPQSPAKPNRPLMDLLGLVAGLAMGVVISVLLEAMDGTVKTEKEVAELIGVPVFGEVPFIPTEMISRQQRYRTILAASGSTVLAAAYVVVVAFTWR